MQPYICRIKCTEIQDMLEVSNSIVSLAMFSFPVQMVPQRTPFPIKAIFYNI